MLLALSTKGMGQRVEETTKKEKKGKREKKKEFYSSIDEVKPFRQTESEVSDDFSSLEVLGLGVA